ncbi:MAG: carbohydrate kinase [Bacteroidaceae bacterium]|nr:carbohydrate kinase [Bacteroidaceae bacterium]
MKYLLGFDVGSSSVKASLVDAETGRCVGSAFCPETEAPIKALQAGWAEQAPDDWWSYLKQALSQALAAAHATADEVQAIGISYQMHGLVCVGRDMKPLRDAIIWCDSRAVPFGERAFRALGEEACLGHLLNSPGNFTASKLAWVKENEPQLFERIHKMMLPGDYIALRMTGECQTTVSGLSEGMLWDFRERRPAQFLLDYFGFPADVLPEVVPTFGIQSRLTASAAAELGLRPGTPVCYRAGDQPNNALSLNVLSPGEVAATAGTSGVVYGVLGEVNYDPQSRVNTFAHVNHTDEATRLGVLLCINGTGILNAWMRRNVASDLSYAQMNELAASVPVGSEGVSIVPFGNGAERMLGNRETGASVHGLNFNLHSRAHLLRAAQEGIVFSFCYGMEIMRGMGMDITRIHAGHANMFLSPIFRQTLASASGATIALYDTDGAVGAARGAGIGCGIYSNADEAFASLHCQAIIEPETDRSEEYQAAYARWKERVENP